MESLGLNQLSASVQILVSMSLLKMVALLQINVKKFMMPNVYLLLQDNWESAKLIVAWHLTHFNFPKTSVITFFSSAHIFFKIYLGILRNRFLVLK